MAVRLCASRSCWTTSAGVVSCPVFTDRSVPIEGRRTGQPDRGGTGGEGVPSAIMTTPWTEDACSLVDAFRANELSPLEALESCIDAIDASPLNACSYTDFERARADAAVADVSLPFGGVPFGVKELERVKGWPFTDASMIFKDRISDYDHTSAARLRATGAVLAVQTTASEFGGINCTSTELHGTTRNPWNHERTPGGSSGGRPPPCPVGCCRLPRGVTEEVRSGSPPDSPASSGSRRPTGASRRVPEPASLP